MHKQVTDSVTERFYVAYLFSRNAKKVYLSIGIGATQFSRIYGESMTKCVPKINDAKDYEIVKQVHIDSMFRKDYMTTTSNNFLFEKGVTQYLSLIHI
mgnify:CR=1 FL=1